jgi:hypothetical protein
MADQQIDRRGGSVGRTPDRVRKKLVHHLAKEGIPDAGDGRQRHRHRGISRIPHELCHGFLVQKLDRRHRIRFAVESHDPAVGGSQHRLGTRVADPHFRRRDHAAQQILAEGHLIFRRAARDIRVAHQSDDGIVAVARFAAEPEGRAPREDELALPGKRQHGLIAVVPQLVDRRFLALDDLQRVLEMIEARADALALCRRRSGGRVIGCDRPRWRGHRRTEGRRKASRRALPRRARGDSAAIRVPRRNAVGRHHFRPMADEIQTMPDHYQPAVNLPLQFD